MKTIIGCAFILCGIALYLGVWWAFVGGVVDVVREIRADSINAHQFAIGLLKICFSGVIGWLCVFIGLCLGSLCLRESPNAIATRTTNNRNNRYKPKRNSWI